MPARTPSKRPPSKPSARAAGMSVDDYVAKAAPDQAATLTALRALVKRAAPKATELIKWGQPVYESNGPLIFMRASRQHVTFGFWRGAMLADPHGLLEGDGNRMRHVKIASADAINRSALTAFIKEAVALNTRHGDPTKRT